jgi:hypothetical protein
MPRQFICIVALLVLSGCRLDVTQTIDLTTKGREVITYTENFDDEAFAATTQIGGASAFGFDAAENDGWDVHGSSGPNEHTFVFKRSFSKQDIEPDLTHLAYESTRATPPDAFFIGPTAFVGLPISASSPNDKPGSIPALLRPRETLTEHGRTNSAFQLANALLNAAAVDTIVHVHVELHDATGVHRVKPSFATPTVLLPLTGAGLHVGRQWPIANILAFWRGVGPYGVFDYEHNAPPLCSAQTKYHKAWMFGVGVYANGARIPERLMTSAVTLAEEWLARHPVKCP